MTDAAARLKAALRTVPDFPKPGIQFIDITPVLQDGKLFRLAIETIAGRYRDKALDAIVGIDARGFILGAAVAAALGTGFVPVRKKGKLPYKTLHRSYDLEYGSATVEIHEDAVRPGGRVALVDDLLATGGTAAAAADLLKQLRAEIVEVFFLIELGFLKGRDKLRGLPVASLIGM